MIPLDEHSSSHSEEECHALLDHLFLEPAYLLETLAHEGWRDSPLLGASHPTPEQRHGEQNLAEEIETAEPGREVVELLRHVVWDIFSNNHSVFDRDGAEYALGSFRGSAGFIADAIGRRYRQWRDRYGYLDFYMGTIWLDRSADLRPVYRWVFGRLRDAGCNWRYSFPRLHAISFDPEPEDVDGFDYDPSGAVQAELDAAERLREVRELSDRLDAIHDEAVEQALKSGPPVIVAAYRDVFGQNPEGWPPRR